MNDASVVQNVVYDLLVILVAGLVAGCICRRLHVSLLVGYLVAGGVLGDGLLGLVTGGHEIEILARVGVLLLLFAIGIEFTIEEIVRLSRYFFVGGSVQMLLVAAPTTAISLLWGILWRPALLIGCAVALSSTVLVFKALAEWGQTASPHGRRAIGILLFQDVALVPLILLVPVLIGSAERAPLLDFLLLGAKSLLFVALVWAAHLVVRNWIVPLLAALRSAEIVVLFVLTLLAGACITAQLAGLPPPLGAFAAGLIVSGTRLSAQIDALVLPYRESFSAVFFVSLGTLLRPSVLWNEPLATIVCLAGVLVLKTGAAMLALRAIGLTWKAAFGMGLGLSQLGEFSFVLLSEGLNYGVLSQLDYNRVLFVALGSLILTPQLLKHGLSWAGTVPDAAPHVLRPGWLLRDTEHAVIIGVGPIGGQVASMLETRGVDVCLIDLSPVNLYPFAQQGFRNVSGDATDPDVLRRAGVDQTELCVVTVPQDRVARQIVSAVRRLNLKCTIIVRCRYQSNAAGLQKVGANAVISEESVASAALLRCLEPLLEASQALKE